MFQQLLAVGLFVGCFAVAAYLEPRQSQWAGERRENALAVLMGDSRRLFANHFFAKADAYFHQGYYPSIFDRAKKAGRSHLVEASAPEEHGAGHEDEPVPAEEGHEEEGHEEEAEHAGHETDFLGEPRDWIDAFGRHFYPSEHTHIEEGVSEREILPWLQLTAELDPHKIETYIVASFTLRHRMNKVKEAEEFLRDGLRANPGNYELYFELGRLYKEHHQDARMARNLWELAFKKIIDEAKAGREPDMMVYMQILGFLGELEEQEGNISRAIQFYELLMEVSPNREKLEEYVTELKKKQGKPS